MCFFILINCVHVYTDVNILTHGSFNTNHLERKIKLLCVKQREAEKKKTLAFFNVVVY